jgi:DNA-binding transcriptional regulator YhcF (GntR family)
MSNRGFILLARGFLTHPRFKPKGAFSNAEAMLWLIETAAHTGHEVSVLNGTRRQIIRLEPGQMTHSIRFLAEAWRWSDKRVQRFLRALVSDQTVTTQTTTGQTVITLCNYAKHQRPFAEATTQNATATTTQTTTKKKELKECKKNMSAGEDEQRALFWYAIYPRKEKRPSALKAYFKTMSGGQISHDDLMIKTAAFAASWAKRLEQKPADRQYIPLPASWLNEERYADEPDAREKSAPPTPPRDPRTFTEIDWIGRLKHLEDGKEWLAERWGPAPGKPGCLVPPRLLLSSTPGPAAREVAS